MSGPPASIRCARCRELRPFNQIIVRVQHRSDSKSVPHGPGWGVVGFPSGRHGVGPPALGPTPAGWHTEWRELWISHLADGTTRRYTDGSEAAWREGENVCRRCRDAQLAGARTDPAAWNEKAARNENSEFEFMKAAPGRLRRSGVPTELLVSVRLDPRRLLPGKREIVQPRGRGWLLGDITWRVAHKGASRVYDPHDEIRLTALVDSNDGPLFNWVEQGPHGLHLKGPQARMLKPAELNASGVPFPGAASGSTSVQHAGPAVRALLGET